MSKKFMQTSYKSAEGSQKVSMSSTAAVLSSQTGDYIETYRVVGNVDYWLASGSSTVSASSTGASDSWFFPAGVPEYINTHERYFSVIANGSSGFVNITEVTQ